MTKKTFKTIGLMGRTSKPETVNSLTKIIGILKARDCEILLSNDILEALPNSDLPTVERSQLGDLCDLVIVVGGDGSMLGAARDLCHSDVYVLGVNRGRLGFLTDVSPTTVETAIDQIFQGNYKLESRFLLELSIYREGELLLESKAFNDVVLSSGAIARMIEFESFVDQQFVNRQRADGIIISTPTGSTAYSLSAGGPIMHPSLDAIVMVPMFPHKLSSRPLVVGGNSEIRLHIIENDYNKPVISCDGHHLFRTKPGDEIFVRKNKDSLTMLHPLEHDFFAACRDKLGWG